VGSLSSRHADRHPLAALTAREWALLVGAVVAVPVSLVLLRSLGYQRTIRLGKRLSPEPSAHADTARRGQVTNRLVWVVDRRLHLPTTCLSRSLALWYLLRVQGVDSTIRIGVRAGGRPLDAHAWVELDGVVLNDLDDVGVRFSTIERTSG